MISVFLLIVFDPGNSEQFIGIYDLKKCDF